MISVGRYSLSDNLGYHFKNNLDFRLNLDIWLTEVYNVPLCIKAFSKVSINHDGSFVCQQAQILSMLSPFYDQRNFHKTKSIKGGG